MSARMPITPKVAPMQILVLAPEDKPSRAIDGTFVEFADEGRFIDVVGVVVAMFQPLDDDGVDGGR